MNDVPQFAQNFALSGLASPQFGQFIKPTVTSPDSNRAGKAPGSGQIFETRQFLRGGRRFSCP